tara:strand:+ start:14 stop:625 length:612 start_codon:yes stop_codon:yes gene_type:complete
MKTFKTFFEDQGTALVPSKGEPLSSFLQRFEGSTIKQILDKSSFVSMYFMNKYGIGGAARGADKAIQDFAENFTRFINRDEHGRGPASFRPRVYETEEFKAKNNYDEYHKLDVQYRQAFKKKFLARKAEDQEAFAAAEQEAKQFSDAKTNSEFGQAERKARQEEDEYVETLHNTPLSIDQLSDDGSKEYKDLDVAYSRVIDSI